MIRLNPNERLLIVNRTNHYQLVGPGWVWLKPWQQALVKLDLGPKGQTLDIDEVRTLLTTDFEDAARPGTCAGTQCRCQIRSIPLIRCHMWPDFYYRFKIEAPAGVGLHTIVGRKI